MDFVRGPGRSSNWSDGKKRTDSKKPSQYIQQWKYGSGLGPYGRFQGGYVTHNATKKDSPQRSTEGEVRISDDDACAIFNALLERKAEDEQRLRNAMQKIDELLGESNLPSKLELVKRIKKLVQEGLWGVDRYGMGETNVKTRKSEAPNWNPFRVGVD